MSGFQDIAKSLQSKNVSKADNAIDILDYNNEIYKDLTTEQKQSIEKLVQGCGEFEYGAGLLSSVLKGDTVGIIQNAWFLARDNNIDPLEIAKFNNDPNSGKIYNASQMLLSDDVTDLLDYSFSLAKEIGKAHGLHALNLIVPGLGVALYGSQALVKTKNRIDTENNIVEMLEKSAIVDSTNILELFTEKMGKNLGLDGLAIEEIEKKLLSKTREEGLKSALLNVNAFMNKEQKHDQLKELLEKENIGTEKDYLNESYKSYNNLLGAMGSVKNKLAKGEIENLNKELARPKKELMALYEKYSELTGWDLQKGKSTEKQGKKFEDELQFDEVYGGLQEKLSESNEQLTELRSEVKGEFDKLKNDELPDAKSEIDKVSKLKDTIKNLEKDLDKRKKEFMKLEYKSLSDRTNTDESFELSKEIEEKKDYIEDILKKNDVIKSITTIAQDLNDKNKQQKNEKKYSIMENYSIGDNFKYLSNIAFNSKNTDDAIKEGNELVRTNIISAINLFEPDAISNDAQGKLKTLDREGLMNFAKRCAENIDNNTKDGITNIIDSEILKKKGRDAIEDIYSTNVTKVGYGSLFDPIVSHNPEQDANKLIIEKIIKTIGSKNQVVPNNPVLIDKKFLESNSRIIEKIIKANKGHENKPLIEETLLIKNLKNLDNEGLKNVAKFFEHNVEGLTNDKIIGTLNNEIAEKNTRDLLRNSLKKLDNEGLKNVATSFFGNNFDKLTNDKIIDTLNNEIAEKHTRDFMRNMDTEIENQLKKSSSFFSTNPDTTKIKDGNKLIKEKIRKTIDKLTEKLKPAPKTPQLSKELNQALENISKENNPNKKQLAHLVKEYFKHAATLPKKDKIPDKLKAEVKKLGELVNGDIVNGENHDIVPPQNIRRRPNTIIF